MRSGRVALVLAALAGVLACGAVTRPTAAAFTASAAASGSITVDRLANYFAVAPGASAQAGSTTPIAAGDVDSQTLAFGTVPAAQTFASVFTVRNTSGRPQEAVLSLTGAPQLAGPVFTSTGTAADTIPAGESRTVQIATVPTVAGRGSGTLRLRLGSLTWLYRDYTTTIDLAPQAPGALSATARAGGVVRLGWSPSTTVAGLAGYDVYRRTAAGTYTKLNAGPLDATSFDDTTAVDGTTYTYVVRALTTAGVTLSSLDSPSATATADATPPGRPASVSLANGGGAAGAYVNAANAGGVSVAVSLPAGSLASDTVTVTLSNGSTTLTKTASGSAGAGTITVSGIDARGLADGTVTITAVSTDAAGNSSAATTGTAPKDTAAPAVTAYYTDSEGNSPDLIWGEVESGASVRADRVSPAPAASYAATTGYGYYGVLVGAHRRVAVTYVVTATDAAGNASAGVVVTANTQ